MMLLSIVVVFLVLLAVVVWSLSCAMRQADKDGY